MKHLTVVAASFGLFGFHSENGCGGEAPIECPLILCANDCIDGHALDENGCETCECNPPPASCDALEQDACLADERCEPIFSDVCALTSGGADVAFPCTPEYLGCRDKQAGCDGLDEQACTERAECHPIYQDVVCDRAPCPPDDPACFVAPCESTYVGCAENLPCGGDSHS